MKLLTIMFDFQRLKIFPMDEPCKAATALASFGFRVVKYERKYNRQLVKPVPLYKLWYKEEYLGAGYNSTALNRMLKIYLIGSSQIDVQQLILQMENHVNPHSMVSKNTLYGWIELLKSKLGVKDDDSRNGNSD